MASVVAPSQSKQLRYAAKCIECLAVLLFRLGRDVVTPTDGVGVAMTTLVLSVIGANVRSPPRRRAGPGRVVNEHRQLRSAPAKRPSGK